MMAYIKSWDEGAPIGATELAEDLDTIVQDFKISIRERMDDLVGLGNWGNDAVNPKTLVNVLTSWGGTFGSVIISSIVGAPLPMAEAISGDGYTHTGTRLTFDDSGLYLLSFSIQMGLAASTAARCFFTKNALTITNLPNSNYSAGSSGFQVTHTITGLVEITAADYIEIFAHHTNYPTGLLSFALGSLTVVKLG